MSKTVVRCSECGKQLFLTDTHETSRGRIAHEVQAHGYIAKLPALYGYSSFVFFCCKECRDKWFAKMPADVKEKGDRAHAQLSEIMNSEDFQRKVQEGLSRIQKVFNRLRKSK